jgi:hypothetical protein
VSPCDKRDLKDAIVGMKWKQQFGHIKLAQANSHRNSLNQIYLVCEALIYLVHNIRHIQCHNIINREIVPVVESMMDFGKQPIQLLTIEAEIESTLSVYGICCYAHKEKKVFFYENARN